MRNPGGYAVITDPYASGSRGVAAECDTFTCSHCNNVVFIPPGQPPEDMGGFCRLCSKHLCKQCASAWERGDDGKCIPFEKKLEQIERRDRLRRAAGV